MQYEIEFHVRVGTLSVRTIHNCFILSVMMCVNTCCMVEVCHYTYMCQNVVAVFDLYVYYHHPELFHLHRQCLWKKLHLLQHHHYVSHKYLNSGLCSQPCKLLTIYVVF